MDVPYAARRWLARCPGTEGQRLAFRHDDGKRGEPALAHKTREQRQYADLFLVGMEAGNAGKAVAARRREFMLGKKQAAAITQRLVRLGALGRGQAARLAFAGDDIVNALLQLHFPTPQHESRGEPPWAVGE